ncbi:hypothetical protein BD769DRAFT_1674125 [Suillus cothurnatus]|nr:hypothetical protein BD769DRAFT_1674125 [Suillus cothurnatus]
MYSRATLEDGDLDSFAEDSCMDSNEESESESEKLEEEEECDPDVELHDRHIEYLFKLAKKHWDFHPFVVDILRKFNRQDPIPEGP